MGEGKLTPLTTPTPLNRQSRNIAHVIMSTISPHKRHLVKIAPGVTSPHIAKVTTPSFFFFLCTQILSTDLELRPLNRFQHAITNRCVFTQGSAFWGLEDNIFNLHPQNPQKTHFGAHIMENLWKIHIRIAAWCIEIRCWKWASCFILPSTLITHKNFSVRLETPH